MQKMWNILFLIKKQNTEYLKTATSKSYTKEKKFQKASRRKESTGKETNQRKKTLTLNKVTVPPQKEKKKIQTNPLLITFINDQIKKCSGCETYFEPGDRRLPKDLGLQNMYAQTKTISRQNMV